MARYIDADKMIYEIRHNLWDWSCVDDIRTSLVLKQTITDIENQPSEDVAPVIHAHWVRWKEPKVTNPVYKCSNCGFDITVDKHPNVSVGFWIDDFRYCLCCGAKMDEEVEDA